MCVGPALPRLQLCSDEISDVKAARERWEKQASGQAERLGWLEAKILCATRDAAAATAREEQVQVRLQQKALEAEAARRRLQEAQEQGDLEAEAARRRLQEM